MEEVQQVQTELADDLSWCTGGALGEVTRLPPWEKDWCSAIPPECKAMQEACAPEPEPQGCAQSSTPAEPIKPIAPINTDAVESTFQAGAIAIGAAIIAAAILAWLRMRPEEVEEAPPVAAMPRIPPPATGSGFDAPLSDDPLSAAKAAAARGELGLALMILRAAALSRLEEKGRVVLHPSRTDREYVRALSSHPEDKDALGALVREIERQRYAGQSVGQENLDRAFDATRKLISRSLVLFAFGMGVAWASPSDITILSAALSSLGFSSAVQEDIPRSFIPNWEEQHTIYITQTDYNDERLERLLSRVRKGNTVILVVSRPVETLPELQLGSYQSGSITWEGGTLTFPDGSWELQATGAETLASHEGTPVALSMGLGEGTLVALGMPQLLEDASVLQPGNLDFLAEIIQDLQSQTGASRVVMLDPSGPPADSPFSAMLRAKLGPALLQGLLAFLVAVWWKGRNFAPPLQAPEILRRDFTEHLKASARLYRNAGASRQMLAAYASYAFSKLRARTRATDAELVKVVAGRARHPLERVERVLLHAKQAINHPNETTAADLYLQEELWEITQDSLTERASSLPASQSGSGGWKLK
jgi:hypothetical protein